MKSEEETVTRPYYKILASVAFVVFVYILISTVVIGWLVVKSERHESFIERMEKTAQQRDVEIATLKLELLSQISESYFTTPKKKKKREVVSQNPNLLQLLKQGIRGPPGPPGRDGKDGRDAVEIDIIDRHIQTAVSSVVKTEMAKVTSVAKSLPVNAGAVYIRWGRVSCPSTSELIMKGVAAGSYYESRGGGSEYICLPDDPEYHPKAAFTGKYSLLSGVEYEYPSTAMFGKNLHDHNAPCAYCQTGGRAQKIMVPGKRRCASGWTLEYEGFLMTENFAHHRNSYVCVDKDAEGMSGSSKNLNGALWYHAIADCKPDKGFVEFCPPYRLNTPLSCVVCTK